MKQTVLLRRLMGVAAAGALALSLAGCSSLATFFADNIPEWAGGLPKDAPPRLGDPRYAEYFKTQIAAQKSIEQRRLADAEMRAQAARIERAQIASGQVERSQSARSVLRDTPPVPDANNAVDNFSLTGRALY